jgi:uncharacterized membrane protein YcaP (DUF421 family)
MFFDSWDAVLHTAVRSAVAYLVIIAALRVLGEQVLAKMTAYDLIVTIALGSIVASIPLSESSLAEGMTAMFVFIGLQEGIRFAQARSRKVRKLVTEEPRVVVWDGRLLHDRIERWNLTEQEIRAALRRAGVAAYSECQAVVLENDGEWSVVRRRDCGHDRSALDGLDTPY